MTREQRETLINNLTRWRWNRLILEGKQPPWHVELPGNAVLDQLLFGVARCSVSWEHREKTADDLAWELFPKPGKVWAVKVGSL